MPMDVNNHNVEIMQGNGVIPIQNHVSPKTMSPISMDPGREQQEIKHPKLERPVPRSPFIADPPPGSYSRNQYEVTATVHREEENFSHNSNNNNDSSAFANDSRMSNNYETVDRRATLTQKAVNESMYTKRQQQQQQPRLIPSPVIDPIQINPPTSPPPRPQLPPPERVKSPSEPRRAPPPPRPPSLTSPTRGARAVSPSSGTGERDIVQQIYPNRSGEHPKAIIYPAPPWMNSQASREVGQLRTSVSSSEGSGAGTMQARPHANGRGERQIKVIDIRRASSESTQSDGSFQRYASLPASAIRRTPRKLVAVKEYAISGRNPPRRPPPPSTIGGPVRIYKTSNRDDKLIEIIREPQLRAPPSGVPAHHTVPLKSTQQLRYLGYPPTGSTVIPIVRSTSPRGSPGFTSAHPTTSDFHPYATMRHRPTHHYYQQQKQQSSSHTAPNTPASHRILRTAPKQDLPPVYPLRPGPRSGSIPYATPAGLIPLGPPIEEVTERRLPETGEVQRVTTRSQSYGDVAGTVSVNEVVEKTEGERTIETHVWRRTTKSPSPSASTRHSLMLSEDENRFQEKVAEENFVHTRSDRVHADVAEESFAQARNDETYADVRTGRTASQTHINRQPPPSGNRYASETNLLTTSTHKHETQPFHSNYSAHRENQRRVEEERRRAENWNASTQQIVDNRHNAGNSEITEEMETIVLQPIGKGIHDLEPTFSTLSRPTRAMTPTAVPHQYAPNMEMVDGYRTIGSTVTSSNWNRDVQASRNQMYYPGSLSRLPSNYEGRLSTPRSDNAILQPDILSEDIDPTLLNKVAETSKYWYKPNFSRAEANQFLRDKEPGSFIIRNGQSFKNSFSLGLRIPQGSPSVQLRPDNGVNEFVRYYLISSMPTTDGRASGLYFNGFGNQPVFQSLVTLVAHHMINNRHLPCALRLPEVGGAISSANQMNSMRHFGSSTQASVNYAGSTVQDHPSYLSGEGYTVTMLFMGSTEIGSTVTSDTIAGGISRILNQTSLPDKREVTVKAIPREGIKLFDRDEIMVKKPIKLDQIAWIGMDPRGREFNDSELQLRGMFNAKVFAVLVKKQSTIMTRRILYVFCELSPSHSAFALVQYMRSIFPCQ